VRHPANTIEDMRKLLIGYRDNMRVEIENGVAVTAKTVADLRALPTWPDGLVLDIHVDLDPRLSVVRVERASCDQAGHPNIGRQWPLPEPHRYALAWRSFQTAMLGISKLSERFLRYEPSIEDSD
jgi:hypothetical protein